MYLLKVPKPSKKWLYLRIVKWGLLARFQQESKAQKILESQTKLRAPESLFQVVRNVNRPKSLKNVRPEDRIHKSQPEVPSLVTRL